MGRITIVALIVLVSFALVTAERRQHMKEEKRRADPKIDVHKKQASYYYNYYNNNMGSSNGQYNQYNPPYPDYYYDYYFNDYDAMSLIQNSDDPFSQLFMLALDFNPEGMTNVCVFDPYGYDWPIGFECDGWCMHPEGICDGLPDCMNFNDESSFMCSLRNLGESMGEYCFDDCGGYDDNCHDCTLLDGYYGSISCSSVCDGWTDCMDGSDENYCGYDNECWCGDYTYDYNGYYDDQWIPCDFWCDGISDCNNNEDEAWCGYDYCTHSCYSDGYWTTFDCGILCNGYFDCDSMEDEDYMCGDMYYTCPMDFGGGSIGCGDVSSYQMCDGYMDCMDGSDEYCEDWKRDEASMKEKEAILKKSEDVRSGKVTEENRKRYDTIAHRKTTESIAPEDRNLPKERNYVINPKVAEAKKKLEKESEEAKKKSEKRDPPSPWSTAEQKDVNGKRKHARKQELVKKPE